jgi:hypothetical protein
MLQRDSAVLVYQSQQGLLILKQYSPFMWNDHSTLKSKGRSRTGGNSNSRGGFVGSSEGKSNSVTNGHSESDISDTRVSDSISDSKTNTKMDETN